MNKDQRLMGEENHSEELEASAGEMEGSFDDPLQHRQSPFGQQRLPLVMAVVGLLIVIVYFVWFSPQSDDGTGGETLANLEARLERLEQQLVTTEELAERLNQMDQLAQQLQVVVTRLDRLETATTQRLDLLTREIETAAQKGSGTPPTAQTGPPATEAPATPGKPRHHVVKAGETLYQISRQYDLKVKTLRDANQLKDTAIIYPGQKLVIPPSSSN